MPPGAVTALPTEPFGDKVVIDACNYYPARDGRVLALEDGHTTSSELVAAHLQAAVVVKAFNPMYDATLSSAGRPDLPPAHRLALFLAGDVPAARQRVADLNFKIGFAPVDVGNLRSGHLLEPGSPVYTADLTGGQAEAALRDAGGST